MDMPVKLEQEAKQESPSDVTNEVLNVTDDKLTHLLKVFVPIDETLFGIEIDLRLIQLKKQVLPILPNDDGSVISDSFSHPSKDENDNPVTEGKLMLSRLEQL